ncbi:hypothetical protein RSOLAG1IB_01038 [Rhizoctonia solani AG-1 IB]|uniref:Uncharacterized protein n=1 Tax=Thanatephorus cucumeris (strain AG1-IB / isolate 7/3/14) TaxID=1108050 RepID=A0A0B7F8D5_THACB|nr:hypothetical protein RSOLAG1IB_01038 [Rhizoctonia solani AG-1 IB]
MLINSGLIPYLPARVLNVISSTTTGPHIHPLVHTASAAHGLAPPTRGLTCPPKLNYHTHYPYYYSSLLEAPITAVGGQHLT